MKVLNSRFEGSRFTELYLSNWTLSGIHCNRGAAFTVVDGFLGLWVWRFDLYLEIPSSNTNVIGWLRQQGFVFTAADVESWILSFKVWGNLEQLGSSWTVVDSDNQEFLPMLNFGCYVSRFEIILNCLVQTAWFKLKGGQLVNSGNRGCDSILLPVLD